MKENWTKYDFKNLKYKPWFWWNYLLLFLLSKNIISVKMVNKIGWRQKQKKI